MLNEFMKQLDQQEISNHFFDKAKNIIPGGKFSGACFQKAGADSLYLLSLPKVFFISMMKMATVYYE